MRYFSNAVRYYFARARRRDSLPYPVSVMLELTNCCNLACITCPRGYRFGREMDTGFMDPEKAKKLLGEIGIYLNLLGVSGLGESFLHPHGHDLLGYVKKINPGVEIFISSNLSMNRVVEVFESWSDTIDVLQISIDGIDGVFNKIRKNGNYRDFLRNLKLVAEIAARKKIYVKMNMVVFRENYFEMHRVVSLAAEYGIKEVYFNRLNPVSIDKSLFDESLYASAEFTAAFAEAHNMAEEKGITLAYPQEMRPASIHKCPFPWSNIYITWDGYMVPCCAKPFPREQNFGNVFEKGFFTCLNSPAYIAFRKAIQSPSPPVFCKGCC